MKTFLKLAIGAAIAATFSLSAWAQSDPPVKLDPLVVTGEKVKLGPEKTSNYFIRIEVRNFQDEPLGRIIDLGVDLINGRIVEALIESDSSLDVGNKVVAVPPLAFMPDMINNVYRLNVSTATFKTAAAIDLSNWEDYGRSRRVAAAYRLFGQEPYFLEEGDTASKTDVRPKVALGTVERCQKLLDLPVGNLQGEPFGKVWTLTMDIPRGRILNVIVLAPGNFLTKSVIPAMALSFNPARTALLLDSTKIEYAKEPRYIFTPAAYGNESYYKEESYQGPRTNVALRQGDSYRDIDQTVRINKNIHASNIDARNIEIGTLNDRVTLRGWAYSESDKNRLGEIAIAASRVELVDNQITVGKPVAAN
ncbi:MAG: BON domain-containing protein [Candidatus Didemnitutus sp.]|nr:BON domain-containing protein [Candidatus Didemnitutus sp.]